LDLSLDELGRVGERLAARAMRREGWHLLALRLATLPGITCEVRRILLAEPLVPVAGSERITELLCRHASNIMGEPVRGHGVPLYTDARHYAKAGIPTVLYGAGPHTILEANAHGADEHLNLEDLRKATEVVTLTLLDLLSPPLL
jgi:acetylornithine deacetylase/succinyl-diaminopimelate desuccinylase-like protein